MVWTEQQWIELEKESQRLVHGLADERIVLRRLTRRARIVMRTYTTGFFLVSRFLPKLKRDAVEIIYAAVRYPDEVVDTFPLSGGEKRQRLDACAKAYEDGLAADSALDALRRGVPCFYAAWTQLVKSAGIPAEHYRAFLGAMRRDIEPRPFETLHDLIDSYIYGSAIVVGYFLTHAYGSATPAQFPEALQSARDLGIALQLTNFLRDVAEDARRTRLYLPLDWLREEGVVPSQPSDVLRDEPAVLRVIHRMAVTADDYYQKALAGLSSFAPDSRVAIRACIDVYRLLNRQILDKQESLSKRESVPFSAKWAALPASKYWRVPWAYLWI